MDIAAAVLHYIITGLMLLSLCSLRGFFDVIGRQTYWVRVCISKPKTLANRLRTPQFKCTQPSILMLSCIPQKKEVEMDEAKGWCHMRP